MIDNKFDADDELWHKMRWTLKFQNCSNKVGGLYYVVYSDKNKTGHINKDETLKDPLTQKWLYSNYDCDASSDESDDILLTKKYGITKVDVSCNSTSTIGQLSFGYDATVYTKFSSKSNDAYNYALKQRCVITLYNKSDENVSIIVEPNTGFIYKKLQN